MISCFKPAINLLIICDLNKKKSRDLSLSLPSLYDFNYEWPLLSPGIKIIGTKFLKNAITYLKIDFLVAVAIIVA